MFTLCNSDMSLIVSPDDVKWAITTQLQGNIIAGDFDVGIVSGGNVISIRSQADLQEVWADIQVGKKAVLWCDGLKVKPAEKCNKCEAYEAEGEFLYRTG